MLLVMRFRTLPVSRIISRVDEVTLRRARSRDGFGLRASLVATAIAIATIFSLIGGYVRPPEAVLRVAFARACAAEAAAAERIHPRLRVDREDVQVDDVDGLPASVDLTKSVEPRGERDGEASPRLASVSAFVSTTPPATLDPYRGVERLPLDSPTRQRARLMVFLN
jgi:hypothetical protein